MMRSLNGLPIISLVLATIVTIVLIVTGLSTIAGKDTVLIPGTTGYSITGRFEVGATPALKRRSVKTAQSRGKDLVLWGSLVEGDGKHTGKLTSPPFKAPVILSLFVAGYPTASGYLSPEYPGVPGNRLYVERVDTQETMKLKVGTPGNRWEEVSWLLPAEWWGHPVRVVAIDGMVDPAGWIGVSSPLATSPLSLLGRQFSSLVLIPLYAGHFALFLVLGLPLAWLIIQSQKLNPAYTLILAIGISALAGYLSFWAYFLTPVFGILFSTGLIVLAIGYAIFLYRKRALTGLLASKDVYFPLLLMLAVGLGYLAVLYGINTGDQPDQLAQLRFFDGTFPPDNVLPKILADRLYNGEDPRPLLGDWQSSDRPPLQAGIFLLQRPTAELTNLRGGLHYQIIGTIAQCSWVAAVWALCRTIKLAARPIAIIMAFCIFSGFFFFHSLFVWPKLLAAALVVFACTVLLTAVYEDRPPTMTEAGLAAGVTALGMLAHGGVVFTVPAIALMLVRPKTFPGIRQIIVGFAVLLVFLAPWSAYQKLYEPPANRLVKWHLAGVIDAADKRSSWEAIVDAYRNAGVAQILHNKWTNVTELVGNPPDQSNTNYGRRSREYFYVFRGLGILNVGWLVYLWLLLKRPAAFKDFTHRIGTILGVILVSLLFWIGVMFGPAATTIHLGSYATMILLFASLAALVTPLPRLLIYALLAFQIVRFIIDWVVLTAVSSDTILMVVPNTWLFGLAILSTVATTYLLYGLSHESQLHPAFLPIKTNLDSLHQHHAQDDSEQGSTIEKPE